MSQMSDKEIERLANAMTVLELKLKLTEYGADIDPTDLKRDLVRKFVICRASHRQHPTGSQSLAPADAELAAVELQTYGFPVIDMMVLFPSNDPNRGTKMLAELQRRKASHIVCCRVMFATGVSCIVFANNLYSATAENAIDTLDQNLSFVRWFSQYMTYLLTLASVVSVYQSYCTWYNKGLFVVLVLVSVFSLSMNT